MGSECADNHRRTRVFRMQQDLSDRILAEFGQILILLASYRERRLCV